MSAAPSSAAGALAVRNGVVIAKTGDEIGNSGEHWIGANFSAFTGNNNGDWVIAGQTDNPDPARQYVIAVNGVIVARQFDPIPLSVPAVIGRANPATNPWSPDNVYLTDDLVLYFLASIQDGQGNEYSGNPPFSTPLAFLRSVLPGGNSAPTATSAASRKNHGASGNFDIPLPLTGNVGIECRTGPDFQIIVHFADNVTVESASVTSGTGTVGSVAGNGTPAITVNLNGVTNAQRVTVTLHNVDDGTNTGDVPISMGALEGDTNGDGFVNAGDALQTRTRAGQQADAANFRSDANLDGVINSGDTTFVRARSGTGLPTGATGPSTR